MPHTLDSQSLTLWPMPMPIPIKRSTTHTPVSDRHTLWIVCMMSPLALLPPDSFSINFVRNTDQLLLNWFCPHLLSGEERNTLEPYCTILRVNNFGHCLLYDELFEYVVEMKRGDTECAVDKIPIMRLPLNAQLIKIPIMRLPLGSYAFS